MPSTTNEKPLGDVPDAFLHLLKAQIELGRGLFEAMTGTQPPAFQDAIRTFQQAAPRPVCHVPPPCWMPIRLGDCTSHVSACGSARIRIVVTNCDRTARLVSVRAEGDEAVTVSPASAQLGPFQRATFSVGRDIPEDAESGRFESLLWIDGCRQHVLRWTVSVGTAGLDSCHEVAVDDCPDHRHHWYDHFYCYRPCNDQRSDKRG